MVVSKNNSVLSVDFRYYFDDVADGVSYQSRACISLEAIHAGLISTVGANRFGVLLAILAFMDTDGKSFPSQRKLAEMTGQSVNTVNKLINELLEIEFQDKPIIRREMIGDGFRKKSMYYISNGIVTATDENEAELKPMNSKDVALYFADAYKEEYGQGYSINYKTELSLIKNKLLPNFDDEALRGVIDIVIRDYKDRWASRDYPLPTIGMLCSWLANKAYALYTQEQEELTKQTERKETALAQDDTDRALDLFN